MDPRTSLNRVKQSWHPPKELERSRPREVCLTAAGKVLACLTGAMLLGGLVAGLALFAKTSRDQEMRMQILQSGRDTEALITGRWTAGRDPVRYFVEYTYHVGGQPFSGRQSIGHNAWLSMERMETLRIRYLPANPRVHVVRGWEPKLLPPWAALVIPAGILFLVAWLLTRIVAWQRRLLAEGRPAPAVVTKIARTQNGKVAHYVFMVMSGKLVNGKSRLQKHPPEVGSVLNVIYEPDHERRNSIYPLSLVRTRMK